MLPKAHVILGLIFSVLIYFIFNLTLFQVSLIFLASVFIDFDHYLFYVKKKKNWNLKKAYFWHKNLPEDHKPMTQIFHTIEFLFLILLLSYFWKDFIFILIGMLFHSITDLVGFIYNSRVNGREFFLTRYLFAKNKSKYF